MKSDHATTVERASDRELVVTRYFAAPPHIVFKAWTSPDLFMRWWTPKSFGITFISCEMDVRAGGGYRLQFGHPAADQPMEFFGKYTEVTPPTRLVWTNDEAGDTGTITTVTFEPSGRGTRVTMRDLHPSKEALDQATTSGSTSGYGEAFQQLDELLVAVE